MRIELPLENFQLKLGHHPHSVTKLQTCYFALQPKMYNMGM